MVRRFNHIQLQAKMRETIICQGFQNHQKQQLYGFHRRFVLIGTGLWYSGSANAQIACPGLRGYNLRKCLQEERKKRGEDDKDVQEIVLRNRQYEQPGELVTLPSGIQYRELLQGQGPQALVGSPCQISYTVYRLSSGAYFKYSSGGTPVYMFSLGYGNEGKDDVGATFSFVLGDMNAVPVAVTYGMQGMRQGGKRRILVPPQLGWVGDRKQIQLQPDNFGGSRRLAGHKDEPLLFEVDLVKVFSSGEEIDQTQSGTNVQLSQQPFRLPTPPLPSRSIN
eukprot:TRINITY_DN62657_c0_g1_i4.p1 TRINITY_DN62657_c0_g1~~TRINITY_DN62657_c0_g1_i4.p1  ORF type:complete len:279 (+),score=30.23 TRINITY_DN62657_c0_g1_i4:59-895(+)